MPAEKSGPSTPPGTTADSTATTSTPSQHVLASRNQSQTPHSTLANLRADLALDLGRSQNADFDEFLKFNLFLVLEGTQKQEVTKMQDDIEDLERSISNVTRANQAERNNGKEQESPLGDSGEGSTQSNGDTEISLLENQLADLANMRQGILDSHLIQCLKAVLPICNKEESELREYLREYSAATTESQMYGPFVRLCNQALSDLEALGGLEPNAFRPADKLDCRFHVSDTKPITTTYKDGAEEIISKPDVVITSCVAAMDVAHGMDPGAPSPAFDQPPHNAFKMRQVLGCGEFKFKKSNLNNERQSALTLASEEYDMKRQRTFTWADDDSSDHYPAEDSAPIVKVINRGEPPTGEPPAKRTKTDGSATARPKASNSKSSQSRASSSAKTSRSGTDGSRGRQGPSREAPEATVLPTDPKNMTNARNQCGQYGLEMLSYETGVHRSMTFLIHNCKLWIWYYDRQGVIQSNGIDFIEDLPRFLVLLFTFQRFGLADWGIIPELNPGAVLAHNSEPTTYPRTRAARTHDERNKRMETVSACTLNISDLDSDSLPPVDPKTIPKEIDIDLGNRLSNKPHTIAGRATAALGSSVPGNEKHLACKISFPEVARQNEGRIIETLRRKLESNPKTKSLVKHLPALVVYGDMVRYGTQRIRSVMRLPIDGFRTLRIMVSELLAQLTTLAGADFVKAWLEVVNFHAFLWHIGVEHGDPSLWNVMYNETLKCGVLGDYDLTILQNTPRIPGTDRTGTIPFMAVEILRAEYWRGKTARVYRHELEAFIWILPFVFLRYQAGKSQRGTLVEKWMTSDHNACRRFKVDFRQGSMLRTLEKQCQADYEDHWPLLEELVYWLTKLDDIIYTQSKGPSPHEDMDSVAAVWPLFIQELKKIVIQASPDYTTKLIEELKLDSTLTLVAALDLSKSDLELEPWVVVNV